MSKLKNYNQRLFALLGTLVVLGLLLIAGAIMYEALGPLMRGGDEASNALISDEEAREAGNQGLRRQVVSFGGLQRLFKDEPYYIVRVSQNTLETPQSKMPDNTMYLNNSFDMFSSGYTSGYYRETNNLILWNSESGISDYIVPIRGAVEDYIGLSAGQERFIATIVYRVDGDNEAADDLPDGPKISDATLWIYRLSDGKRDSVDLSGHRILGLVEAEESALGIATLGEDLNGNGHYDSRREPASIYRINPMSISLVPLVDADLKADVQSILDGE